MSRLGLLVVLKLAPLQVFLICSLHFYFAVAGLPLGDVASMLAFAFASRGFDGWLLLQDHKLDNVHPYSDDSDSKHTANSHSEVLNTFDLCTRQCASTTASYPHNEV